MNSIGKYLVRDSLIHKLDARVKLLANIVFIVLIFIANNFIVKGSLILLVMIAFVVTTNKPLKLLSTFKFPLWVGIFLFIINCFVLDTSTNNFGPVTWENYKNVYWVWWFKGTFKIDYQILITTINIVLGIYGIVLTMSTLTLSTPPVLITKALEFYFTPLKWIKIPINILITIITISIRFVPTLIDEAQRILKAQSSRGVDFRNGNIKTKVKASIVLIVPLFVSAFSKAEDLSNAMESRGYNPYGKKTSYYKWNIDWFSILSLIFILAIIVVFALNQNNTFNIPLNSWYWSNNTFF